jgi:hypothetical protein
VCICRITIGCFFEVCVMILTLIHRLLLQEGVRETPKVVDNIDDTVNILTLVEKKPEIFDDEVMLG